MRKHTITLRPEAFMSGHGLLDAGLMSLDVFNQWHKSYRPPRYSGNRFSGRSRSHYTPHQGAAEIARRSRQLAYGTLRTTP